MYMVHALSEPLAVKVCGLVIVGNVCKRSRNLVIFLDTTFHVHILTLNPHD